MPTLAIGEVAQRTGIAATALRYYEQIGLIGVARRVGGRRRYDESVLPRLEVIRLCKAAGFTLDEITLLLTDDADGRPSSRALGAAKLIEIDRQIDELQHARRIIEWGLRCTCPSIGACTCGIHANGPFGTSA
jgi:DNA-binding transcriptional MerR regulator